MELSITDESSDEEDNVMMSHIATTQAVLASAMTIAMEPESSPEQQWGGSKKGKARNKERDFAAAYHRLVQQYFSGTESVYNEVDFARRFRMPRTVFNRVWENLNGKAPFQQYHDCVTKRAGIHPLVRFVACLRKLSYGDCSDRNDEKYEISESTLDTSFKAWCKLIKQEFGQQYLHRCPTQAEVGRSLNINRARGFPGLFASWDCKHFVWKRCPNALAGQHKGKGEKNTIVLEAICDGDLYIWYSFFGSPGSLNDINILDRSSIVASILNGSFDLRLPVEQQYTINGTTRDYFYFLVDGIYPKWSIFISTIAHAAQGSKEAYFASCQEAIRKDIERAFGVLVARFEILQKPILAWDESFISDIVDVCIILHNMIVEERRTTYVSEAYLERAHDLNVHDAMNESTPISLFQTDVDGLEFQHLSLAEKIAERMANIDNDLKREVENIALQYDLLESLWENRK
jgi:Plant transposon protein